MKKKTNKDLIIFLILIPILLWVTFSLSSSKDNGIPNYSVLNKAKSGCSVFYEALQKLNYPVKRIVTPLAMSPTNNIQVVVPGGDFDISDSSIITWVEDGGVIIYLTQGNFHFVINGTLPTYKGNLAIYKFKKGKILAMDVSYFENAALKKKTKEPYLLLKELTNYSYSNISFNENNLFLKTNSQTLWDYIPFKMKFFVYQLILLLGAFFYYKSKRFGKTLPLYDEVERTENEYLYSAAALYKQAHCSDLMLDNYYQHFLKQIGYPRSSWLEYWNDAGLPSMDKATKVFTFMNSSNPSTKSKDILGIVKLIDELTNILKRRDQHWNTQKKAL